MARFRASNFGYYKTRNTKLKCYFIILLVINCILSFNCFANNDEVDFGWVLVNANKCDSFNWLNRSPGVTLVCDSQGCRCTPVEIARNVIFSISGQGYSISSPTGSVVISGCGQKNIQVCTPPITLGDHYSTVTANVSPAFYGGSTMKETIIHIKGIPSLVTCEPLLSSLDFGSIQIGRTASKTFKVYNYNTFPVSINAISINNSNFLVTTGIGSTISAAYSKTPGSKDVTIKFAPQTIGSFNANIQVYTTAEDPTYTCSGVCIEGPAISTSSTGYGTITPSTTVPYGEDITIEMIPSPGHTLNSLTDNGKIVTADFINPNLYEYELNCVTKNHSLIASFRTFYNVNANVIGTGGTILPETSANYYGKFSQTYTLTPQSGYTIDMLTDNGIDVTQYVNFNGNTFQYVFMFNNMNQNHTLQAKYKMGDTPALPGLSSIGILIIITILTIIYLWKDRKKRTCKP